MALKPSTTEAYRLFHEGALALSRMEYAGCRIDVEYLDRASAKITEHIRELEGSLRAAPEYQQWRKLFGAAANLDSRPQLGKLLFEAMGLPCEVRTEKSGLPKVDEHVLGRIDLPFVKNYLKLAELKKAKSTHLDGLRREVVGGKVHPSFNLHLVSSFRSSASEPNVQNIPSRDPAMAKTLRRCYIPRPGRRIVEIDFGQLEVRISAAYHNDPALIDYCRDPSKDMHRDTAVQLFCLDDLSDVPEGDEKYPKNRKNVRHVAKNKFVFPQFYGSVYFQCAPSIWEAMPRLRGPGNVSMRKHLKSKGITALGDTESRDETRPGTFVHHVREVERDFWSRRFRVYTAWKDRWYKDYLKNGGYNMLTGFRVEGVYKRNQVINYPVQGSAFHCLLWSIIEIDRDLRRRKMRSRLIIEIHDSLIADVPDDEVQEFISLSVDVMTRRLPAAWEWINVPLEVEVEVSPIDASWAEKESWIARDGIWRPAKEPA